MGLCLPSLCMKFPTFWTIKKSKFKEDTKTSNNSDRLLENVFLVFSSTQFILINFTWDKKNITDNIFLAERRKELNFFLNSLEINPSYFSCQPTWIFLNPNFGHTEASVEIYKLPNEEFQTTLHRLQNFFPHFENQEVQTEEENSIKEKLFYVNTNIEYFKQFADMSENLSFGKE